jgi:hypothetical protein
MTQPAAPQFADQGRDQQTEHQCNGKRDKHIATDVQQRQHGRESYDADGAIA